MGARWRIGRGKSTRIWSDKWLPSPSSGLPLSPPTLLDADEYVSSLILHDSGTWNSELIDQVFIPSDAELIKSIPLSIQVRDDALVWSREKNGKYSVRSAYRLLTEAESSSHQSCSDLGTWKKFWKTLWSVRVPYKVRHFLWRACSNALPTMVNLSWRGIVTNGRCGFCLGEEEDILHAVWRCSALTAVWGHHGVTKKILRVNHLTFPDVLSYIFERGSEAKVAEVAFMFWCVWQRRNKALYQASVDPIDSIFPLAQRLTLEYSTANEGDVPLNLSAGDVSRNLPAPIHWRPSTVCDFKVNFDAAVFPKQGGFLGGNFCS
jgi:hypothetical protein